MALVLRSVLNFYNHVFVTLSDPRTANYVLIGDSPLPVISILIGYTLFCKYGPRYMDSRKPVELKSVMSLYNFAQVILNTVASSVVRISICFNKKFSQWFYNRPYTIYCGNTNTILPVSLLTTAVPSMEWRRSSWYTVIL